MTGWIIGFMVGGVVVLLVVVLLLAMIVLARRINAKAESIHAGLIETRDRTSGLWELSATKATLDRVTAAASDARETLAGEAGEAGRERAAQPPPGGTP